MIELPIQAVATEDAGDETPALTRERLSKAFPAGATRRMTQLGMLMGVVLARLDPAEEDTLVYASSFAEGRALEDYLAGFPTPSPTLFQSSIHPSAVQQALIVRQRSLRRVFPHSGDRHMVAQAFRTAALAPAGRVLLCGGEERGGRLREHGVSGDHSFAFALALGGDRAGATGVASVSFDRSAAGELELHAFFGLVAARKPHHGAAGPGIHLDLTWT